MLIDSGADISNRNADQKTPLHTFFSEVLEQVLRCHGELFDFSAPDSRGMTPLHYLAWSSKTPRKTFERYHKGSGFDVRTVDEEGRSVLHFAAQRGNRCVIEYLFDAGVDLDVDVRDCQGKTALHYAMENKRACGTMEALISHGANTRAKDHQGRSALHVAAKLDNLAVVKALLAAGMTEGDLHTADRHGMIPMQTATAHRATAVLAFLADLNTSREGEVDVTGLNHNNNFQSGPACFTGLDMADSNNISMPSSSSSLSLQMSSDAFRPSMKSQRDVQKEKVTSNECQVDSIIEIVFRRLVQYSYGLTSSQVLHMRLVTMFATMILLWSITVVLNWIRM